jgi:hypothetical protein
MIVYTLVQVQRSIAHGPVGWTWKTYVWNITPLAIGIAVVTLNSYECNPASSQCPAGGLVSASYYVPTVVLVLSLFGWFIIAILRSKLRFR